MNESIESLYSTYTNDRVQSQLTQNRATIERELIEKIPYTNCYRNTINIAVGRQRTGKSVSITTEIIKIAEISLETHLLVHIDRNGSQGDDSFKALAPLIKIPIVYLSEDEAEGYIKNLLMYKDLYNTIKDEHLEDKIVDEQKEALLKVLYINDLDKKYLHTLIFCEDCAKSKYITTDNSYFNKLMIQCGHIQCSFFLAVQYWKALSTNIKANVSTIFVFAGFSRQQLGVILFQTNIPYTISQLYEKYMLLKGHDKMVVDSYGGNVGFDTVNL